jgi:O-antigen/teichoic acid export membrane protein
MIDPIDTGQQKMADRAEYRSIFKATSIFGGVQVFNIIITIIRGKAVAVLLGSSGMGLNALFLSTLKIITQSTSFGLPESAVKDIAEANGSGDIGMVNRTVAIFKRWIWLTAFLGASVTLIFSHLISKWTFGNEEYTFSFMLLSVTFVFGALTSGIYTVLRGLRRLKLLAKANIFGSAAGLLVSLPFFYFYGEDGIVPAIIAASIATYFISLFFRKKISIDQVKLSWNETWHGGTEMAKLGITMSMSTVFISLSAYLLSIYIVRTGSMSDLGLYSAGNSIIVGYTGMVFRAMGMDYFPRLSEVINLDPEKWKLLVNQQAELVVLILGPVLLTILLSAPYLIKLLLTNEFLGALGFIIIASPAILLKGVTWCLGFIYLAKGAKKIFFFTQLIANIILLAANIGAYYLYGINGLGIALLGSFSIFTIFHYLIVRYKYSFRFNYQFSFIFWLQLSVILTGMIMSLTLSYFYFVLFFSPFLIGSCIYSIYQINRRIDLLQYLKSRK